MNVTDRVYCGAAATSCGAGWCAQGHTSVCAVYLGLGVAWCLLVVREMFGRNPR